MGAKFYSDVAGTISAVRFYKSAKNTGTHIGNVWSESGQRLATVTFSGESATGWQTRNTVAAPGCHREYQVRRVLLCAGRALCPGRELLLQPPVSCTRRKRQHGQRTAPFHPQPARTARTASTGTARRPSFPIRSTTPSTTGWMLSFSPSGNPAPAVSSVSPANNATGVDVAVKPSATFNQAVTGISVVFTLKDRGRMPPSPDRWPTTPPTNTATFTPGAALALQHHLHGHGQRCHERHRPDHGGTVLWTFTTAAAPAAPAVASVSPANNAYRGCRGGEARGDVQPGGDGFVGGVHPEGRRERRQ